MKRKKLESTAAELEEVLQLLNVNFSRTDVQTSRTSKSIYFKLFHKNGTVSLRIRISDHPHVNMENTQNTICIGDYRSALYGLDEWYQIIPSIGNAVHCVEVKMLGAKIIGEIEAKKKQPDKEFQKTLENVRNKIIRPACSNDIQDIPEKAKREMLAGLLTGFATRFDLNIQKTTLPSGYLFRLQYQNWQPAYVAASQHKPDTLPHDCPKEHLILIGNYWAANFRCQDWKDILRITLSRVGLIGKAHKKTLEQFIKKKAERGFLGSPGY